MVMPLAPIALAGALDAMTGANCYQLLAAFSEAVADAPAGASVFETTICRSGSDEGPATAFSYTYVYEPRAAADVPALAAFVARHEGRRVAGEALHFRRAVGVLAEMRFDFAKKSAGDALGTSLWRQDLRADLASHAAVTAWRDGAKAALAAPDVEGFLTWLTAQDTGETADASGADMATYLRTFVLPETRRFTGALRETLILEDRALVDVGGGESLGTHDCRSAPGGHCLTAGADAPRASR